MGHEKSTKVFFHFFPEKFIWEISYHNFLITYLRICGKFVSKYSVHPEKIIRFSRKEYSMLFAVIDVSRLLEGRPLFLENIFNCFSKLKFDKLRTIKLITYLIRGQSSVDHNIQVSLKTARMLTLKMPFSCLGGNHNY